MSCYYFLRCRVCEVEHDELGYNHAGDELLEVLAHRELFARYAELRRNPKLWPFTTDVPGRLEQLAEFLLEHREHQDQVFVVDEYGRERD